jgi:adenosine deaminase
MADLHLHQEAARCLDRILARREGRPPFDWAGWRRQVIATTPGGPERLRLIGSVKPVPLAEDDTELFIARFAELLKHAGAAGADYVEIRCDAITVLRDEFMDLFRRAEKQAQLKYPRLYAEAIAIIVMSQPAEQLETVVQGCLRARTDGLSGVDFLYQPYCDEADWTDIYRVADRCAAAGLGVTAHAGEMSPANISAAVATPGLTRIGHGIHAAYDPALIELLIDREITLECPLYCNVFLGATESLESHPLPALVDAGVAVTLATDNPIQVGTDIGAEYAAAASLGLSETRLRAITRRAFEVAFTTPGRRRELLDRLDGS